MVYTIQDARRDRALAGLEQAARWQAEDEARARTQRVLLENPQIGVLMRAGKPMYYVYPADGSEYIEARDPSDLVNQG